MIGSAVASASPGSGYAQSVSVTGGKIYRLSQRSWTSDQAARARLQVNWLDASGRMIQSSIKVVDVGRTPVSYTTTMRAPDQAAAATVYATPHDGGVVWFDSMSLQELQT